MSRSGIDQLWRVVWGVAVVLGCAQGARAGQLSALVSPGPLSKAHAGLEGVASCSKCHEVGRKVTTTRCLSCHKPIADRMAKKTGVHRNVTNDCVKCHTEHAGPDAELRRIDARTFNHVAETGFALDGVHAKTAATCAACHKARSFLDAKPACASCHTDVHKGSLGANCARCHSTMVSFKAAAGRFDHSTARFTLTGAHQTVACAKCHTSATYRGLAFESCTACHLPPHRKTLGPSCTSCHTTERWTTRTVDHSRTAFPLAGLHAQVACAKCHQAAIVKPVRFDQCSACHANVHKQSLKEDCRACHTEKGFRGAAFDHATRTAFPLEAKHAGLACRKCHTGITGDEVPLARKAIDYGGAKTDCASCHKDPHKGAYGVTCDGCHRPTTFDVAHFVHPRAQDFFGDRHTGVACEKCHVRAAIPQPVRTALIPPLMSAPPSMACASCHADVHLGQLDVSCERCHSIAGAKFAAVRFAHESSRFPLTGKHQTTECAKCHATETRTFPAAAGRATQFHPASECRTCHIDPHLGQVDARCETCHSTTTFAVPTYAHGGLDEFFAGFHGKYPCRSCHKQETRQFPAGAGTAVRFTVGRACVACHLQF